MLPKQGRATKLLKNIDKHTTKFGRIVKKGKFILFPFGFIYWLLTEARNFLYKVRFFKQFEPKNFTIGIGNIQVGGTGKTPFVAFLIEKLMNQNLVIISRGYGRNTKGLMEGTSESKPAEIGDEMALLVNRYNKKCQFWVSEKRINVFKKFSFEANEWFVLDDCMQHLAIKPHFLVALTSSNALFYDDYILPIGRLRETKKNIQRADCLFVTNFEGTMTEKQNILESVKRYFNKPVFFSKIHYHSPISFTNQFFDKKQTYILISGVGQPSIFETYCQQQFDCKVVIRFIDHKKYRQFEIDNLLEKYKNALFLTTEKDFVKLRLILSEKQQNQFFYLPISIELEYEKQFFDLLETYYQQFILHYN